MTGGENRTKNPTNSASALIRELNRSQLGSCPLNPEITGLRLTRKSRFAQVGRTQAEMWRLSNRPNRIWWMVKNAGVLPWLTLKEACYRVRVRRLHETFNALYTRSMGPFAISNRGGLALWLS